MKLLIPLVSLLVFLTACATSSTGSPNTAAKRKLFKDVRVFLADGPPSHNYSVLATLKDDAGEDEEEEITIEFQKKAAKLGGDAILFKEKRPSGMEVVPFGFGKIRYTYLYRVEVLKFE